MKSVTGYQIWRLYIIFEAINALHWRHNEPDGVSNHQPRDCLLNYLFRFRSKKISKLRVTGLCAENSPGTGEFSAQKGSNAENVFIWWSHHGRKITLTHSWFLSRSGWPGCDETLSWCVALPTRCIYQVSNWYLKACWKKVQKTFRWLGALLTPPSGCFCPQRAKNWPTMTKISRGQDTHFISVCTKSEASIQFLRPWMQKNDFDLFLAVK